MIINSKRFGRVEFILDQEDSDRIEQLGGRWCVVRKRGKFYAQKRLSSGLIELQRFIMQPPKGLYVDHINRNTLDNRRANLRICTNAANLRNGRVRPNSSSGVTGVTWDKARQKWAARIKVMYKQIHLGRFPHMADAVAARKAGEKLYWD